MPPSLTAEVVELRGDPSKQASQHLHPSAKPGGCIPTCLCTGRQRLRKRMALPLLSTEHKARCSAPRDISSLPPGRCLEKVWGLGKAHERDDNLIGFQPANPVTPRPSRKESLLFPYFPAWQQHWHTVPLYLVATSSGTNVCCQE